MTRMEGRCVSAHEPSEPSSRGAARHDGEEKPRGIAYYTHEGRGGEKEGERERRITG